MSLDFVFRYCSIASSLRWPNTKSAIYCDCMLGLNDSRSFFIAHLITSHHIASHQLIKKAFGCQGFIAEPYSFHSIPSHHETFQRIMRRSDVDRFAQTQTHTKHTRRHTHPTLCAHIRHIVLVMCLHACNVCGYALVFIQTQWPNSCK